MEDYQKEKLNKMLLRTAKDEIKWLGRIKDNPNSNTYVSMVQRMAECNGRKTGIIETALTLGYKVAYIDGAFRRLFNYVIWKGGE